MAEVRVNSGPVEADYPLHMVPQDKWEALVLKRQSFMRVRLTYDCRCLVSFVKDAEQMWQPLGYSSADDLIVRGYELSPEDIRLAVRWLELKKPGEAVGLEEVRRKAQGLAADEAVKPMSSVSNPTGRNQYSPEKDTSEVGLSDNPTSAARGTGSEYLVRRLKRDAPEIADALGRGEYPSARAAGIAAGIVKVPTGLDLLRKAWAKATEGERDEFLKEVKQEPTN